MKRLLSGLQPSGNLTLGNYIGSLRQFKEYQDNFESFIFIPDMHSITVEQDPKLLKQRIIQNIALYIASGLDPKKNIFFIQSENLYHANLSWILECNSYFGELGRMTQFKDKSSKKEKFYAGLFTYPVLMAADILLYSSDVVPTGLDQKQHVELARNIAQRFNRKYGDTFVVPEPMIPKVGAKIKDLQEPFKKMSKSSERVKGTIFLLDTEKDIRKKIMSAITDNDNCIYYDEENKPGISNLLGIYSVLKEISIVEAENEFRNCKYGEFKKIVADITVKFLLDLQYKYNNLLGSDELNRILDDGREITNKIAKEKYEEVRQKVGLGR